VGWANRGSRPYAGPHCIRCRAGKEQSDTSNIPLRRGFDLYIELPGQILLELELKECSAPVGDHIDSCVFGESADGCYRSSLR
jgi:hypothetical protein